MKKTLVRPLKYDPWDEFFVRHRHVIPFDVRTDGMGIIVPWTGLSLPAENWIRRGGVHGGAR